MQRYDVIIIGAGPAGAIASKTCTEKGLSTLLLEKERIPRFKPCGGAVSTSALSHVDFGIEQDLIERECYGERVHFENHQIEVRRKSRMAILVSRDKFDAFLVSKAVDAGVELREVEKARSLNQKQSTIVVETNKGEYNAKVVIGADGVNSIVSKYVREPYKHDELGLCIAAEIPVSNAEVDEYIENAVDIHYGISKSGYGWVFPKEQHFSAGVGGDLSSMKNSRSMLLTFLKKLGLSTDVVTHAHLIPSGGYEREVCSDRIILVGDAAGFVDPFYGEGIKYAFISGKLAAERVVESYENDEFSKSALDSYKRSCRTMFGENLEYSLRLTRLVNKYPNIFFRLLSSDKKVLDKGLEIVAERMRYKEYRRWLIPRVPYFMLKALLPF
ncbi:Digeranylgeranylglycerophospholipid reductase [ANME-1 cluster archaeon GoMg1]|nr:Digeranylgeranylglycerophospholipid reductase [ANME-1 cluster archaeon GoMg1]